MTAMKRTRTWWSATLALDSVVAKGILWYRRVFTGYDSC
jgi:hypothetical protein